MRLFAKALELVARFFSFFSIFATAGMMVISVIDVIARNIFGHPLIGATELVQILNVGIILAMGMGCLTSQNISVDFIMDALPKVPRHLLQILCNLFTIIILGLLAWRGVYTVINYYQKGYGYNLIHIPYWPFVIVVCLGLLGGILAVLHMTINEARGLAGKDPYKIKETQGEMQK